MKTKMYHYPLLVAYKRGAQFTGKELSAIIRKALRRSIDNAIHTYSSWSGDASDGEGCVMLFDVYNVKQLGLFKRLLHGLRVVFTAVSTYVGHRTTLVVVIGY